MAEAHRGMAECPPPDQIIGEWDGKSREAAQAMMDKYGPPDESTPNRLIWNDNGPWKRTIVTKEQFDHKFPMPHKDCLEQSINYHVPVDKVDDLAAYDGSVIVERTKGTMAARCDKEEANMLALNLADDIVKGNKTVAEARQVYTETIGKLMAGDKPEYTQGLRFGVPSADEAADPDESTMSESMMAMAKEKMGQMGEKIREAL